MGNGCEKCCSLTDEQSELLDGEPLNGSNRQSQNRTSSGTSRGVGSKTNMGYLNKEGLQPVVSRSGQHYDFKNTGTPDQEV